MSQENIPTSDAPHIAPPLPPAPAPANVTETPTPQPPPPSSVVTADLLVPPPVAPNATPAPLPNVVNGLPAISAPAPLPKRNPAIKKIQQPTVPTAPETEVEDDGRERNKSGFIPGEEVDWKTLMAHKNAGGDIGDQVTPTNAQK